MAQITAVKESFMASSTDTQEIQVFVHLAHGFGRNSWKKRFDKGEIIGINHQDPYGYQQAKTMGCRVAQAEDFPENRMGRLLRLGIRALLGFDLLHAWRNRQGIFAADVVWTHTESQALAILLLMRQHAGRRPKLLAQTIWLMDAWDSYSGLRQRFYRSLLKNADVLTFHSTLALRKAEGLFPGKPTELVRYGIRADQQLDEPGRPLHTPIRLLMLGNDRHRDWPTFIKAVKGDARLEAKAVTRAKLTELIDGAGNIKQEVPRNNEELFALFRWTDFVVVCLTQNLHASGLTVIQEAVLCGVPVICSAVGGLESYFTEDEISYVTAGNPAAIRETIDRLSADNGLRQGKVQAALARMKSGNINSRSFVARHVELSRQMLGR